MSNLEKNINLVYQIFANRATMYTAKADDLVELFSTNSRTVERYKIISAIYKIAEGLVEATLEGDTQRLTTELEMELE